MTKQELEAFAKEAAKGFKSQQDLVDFSQILTKITVEAATNAELDDHRGYKKPTHFTSMDDKILSLYAGG